MNNSNKILSVLVVITILAGGMYFFTRESSQNAPSMVKKDPPEVMVKEEAMVKNEIKTGYPQFTKSVLDQSMGGRRVLFFYANWCPTCKAANANFEQSLTKIPADVTLIRVNYADSDTDQEEKDLAKEYGITYQHTFVQIDTDGKEMAKWNGGQIEELLSNIK